MKDHKETILCSATESETQRHFSLSRKIKSGKGVHEVAAAIVEDPCQTGFTSHCYTEGAARAINRILAVNGVTKITTYPQELSVDFAENIDGDQVENAVLEIIKSEIFPGVHLRTWTRELVA